MLKIFAQTTDAVSTGSDVTTGTEVVTTTTGTIYAWVETPMVVALLFALAGSFFVAIYFLRSRRKATST